jgi:hypothetical protein
MVYTQQRVDDPHQFDSSNAQALETRSVQEAGPVQVPGITGKNYNDPQQG